MKFYNTLLSETECERDRFFQIEQIKQGTKGNISLNAYVSFLGEAYQHVKHTVPLLMLCGSKLKGHQAWMRKAIIEYINEEYGHEEWILSDIKACGKDQEYYKTRKANKTTELMISYAYDSIERKNPVTFFGMVLVLEGISTELATQAAIRIQSNLDLPENAFSYLISHGNLDIDHVKFYETLINKITNPDDQKSIVEAAKIFYHLYGNIFKELPL